MKDYLKVEGSLAYELIEELEHFEDLNVDGVTQAIDFMIFFS
jgi:predicted metalloprotease